MKTTALRLGHVHLKVRNLARSTAFYTRFFGLDVTERVGHHYAFLSDGLAHHTLALQQVPPQAQTPGRYDVGLHHLAFEVPDDASFVRLYFALKAAEIPAGLTDHRISWAMYFADPDGNGVEVYLDTRDQGAPLWSGWDLPLQESQLTVAVTRR